MLQNAQIPYLVFKSIKKKIRLKHLIMYIKLFCYYLPNSICVLAIVNLNSSNKVSYNVTCSFVIYQIFQNIHYMIGFV